nr:PREDICTED: U-box domain-containing protein 15-like [Nicotiana tabacum]
MTKAWENEHEEAVTVEEEFGSSCQTSPQDKRELVRELISVIQTVGSYEEYRKSQREECHNLVQRLKLLLPLLEEIRDFDGQIPESGIECLMKLKKAFSSAKKLLKTCYCGSKIYLALESEAVMGRFYSVYERLSQALEGMPYDELGISDEEKEQFRRAKKRNDTQDMELAMDLLVALSSNNDRNADSASIDRLGHKLGLHTVKELKAETISVRKVVRERKGRHAQGTQKITVYTVEIDFGLRTSDRVRKISDRSETSRWVPKMVQTSFEPEGRSMSSLKSLSSSNPNRTMMQSKAIKFMIRRPTNIDSKSIQESESESSLIHI